jgi:hypothetical protein
MIERIKRWHITISEKIGLSPLLQAQLSGVLEKSELQNSRIRQKLEIESNISPSSVSQSPTQKTFTSYRSDYFLTHFLISIKIKGHFVSDLPVSVFVDRFVQKLNGINIFFKESEQILSHLQHLGLVVFIKIQK